VGIEGHVFSHLDPTSDTAMDDDVGPTRRASRPPNLIHELTRVLRYLLI